MIVLASILAVIWQGLEMTIYTARSGSLIFEVGDLTESCTLNDNAPEVDEYIYIADNTGNTVLVNQH